MTRVLCAGHVNWDVTLRVDRLPAPDGEVTIEDRVQKGGGSASNVAAGLTGFNLDTGLCGSVGDDDSGRLAVRELDQVGVDVSHVRRVEGAETAVKYLVVDGSGEVMVLASEGANEAFTADDLGGLRGVAHLHLTSQSPDTAAELAARADEQGVPVSFDPGRRLDRRDYADTFEHVDLLFVNRREATALADGDGFDALPPDAVIVIKLGEGGGEVRTPAGSYTHDGFDIDPVDTTGAGDAFAAGFIASVQRDGGLDDADFEAALETANACGAIGATQIGARVELSWERVEAFRSRRG